MHRWLYYVWLLCVLIVFHSFSPIKEIAAIFSERFLFSFYCHSLVLQVEYSDCSVSLDLDSSSRIHRRTLEHLNQADPCFVLYVYCLDALFTRGYDSVIRRMKILVCSGMDFMCAFSTFALTLEDK